MSNRLPILNFPTLWALAILIHMEFGGLWDGGGSVLISSLFCSCLAMMVLILPGSTLLFSGMLITQLLDVFFMLPECPNHWMLVCLTSAILLGGIIWQGVLDRGIPPLQKVIDNGRLPLQLGIVFFYWWTALWKLNTDFFSSENSCAYHFTAGLFQNSLSIIAAPLGALSPPITVLLEVFLPLALLFKRWRYVGLLGLVIFHAILGLYIEQRLLNFSTVMFALLWLFTTDREPENYTPERNHNWRVLAVLAGLFLMIAPLVMVEWRISLHLYARFALWLPLAAFILTRFQANELSFSAEKKRVAPIFWLFPVLILLNGTTPSLGLKTGTSWQMYSNIQISPDSSNHFLIPPSADLMGWMSDTVTIHDSSSSYLKTYFSTGNPWPTVFVRTLVRRQPGVTLSYEHEGLTFIDQHWEEDPLFREANPLWVEKMARFGALTSSGRNQCTW